MHQDKQSGLWTLLSPLFSSLEPPFSYNCNCICNLMMVFAATLVPLFQNESHSLAPASLQLLQQLQATSNPGTQAGAANANALSNVQHQLLLQQHLGLGGATPTAAAPQTVPSQPEINPANLQGLATLASLNSTGEYGQYTRQFFLSFLLV